MSLSLSNLVGLDKLPDELRAALEPILSDAESKIVSALEQTEANVAAMLLAAENNIRQIVQGTRLRGGVGPYSVTISRIPIDVALSAALSEDAPKP